MAWPLRLSECLSDHRSDASMLRPQTVGLPPPGLKNPWEFTSKDTVPFMVQNTLPCVGGMAWPFHVHGCLNYQSNAWMAYQKQWTRVPWYPTGFDTAGRETFGDFRPPGTTFLPPDPSEVPAPVFSKEDAPHVRKSKKTSPVRPVQHENIDATSGTDTAPKGGASSSNGNPAFEARPKHGASNADDTPEHEALPLTEGADKSPRSVGAQDREQEEPLSVGSVHHDAGCCKPCRYFHTQQGCSNGRDCTFCHMAHDITKAGRPTKAQRARCKKIASLLVADPTADLEQVAEEVFGTRRNKVPNPVEILYIQRLVETLEIEQKQPERRPELDQESAGSSIN